MYFLLVLLYNISVYHDIHLALSPHIRRYLKCCTPHSVKKTQVNQVLLSDLSENFQLVTTGFVITIRILHALWLLFEQCRITNS